MDCVFCKILKENAILKVAESDLAVAFMDIAGDVDGHILVVPKKHVESILDCDEETLSAVFSLVKKVSLHLVENCGYEGVNLLNASGIAAGQSVGHFHIHIIPRKTGDGLDTWPKFDGAKCDIKTIYEKIKL